ncbi:MULTISPECIES: DUF5302 domain-containing protein [unclassified Streptomyces]|uniref:DUF5302 domain-containing protein n=1 Tax=unclassified Streptomyces TaxID=2593676 RepID=UPI002DDB2A61|nr:DUF5302 domain-containing protein [Streptomyces sp. NBC_01750]WSA98240.1 DUF5302 domain-containing protein [Streptomyces sp. NBC_01794]WSD37223.1 DUF5302 domain-containing protein [Streptomyces sp. NBC_01750]
MTDTPQWDSVPQDDAKDKFKKALEQKGNASRAKKAHQDGRMQVKNMSGPAGQKRFYRRKTG